MSALVFCGPTLSPADREAFADFTFLPPVQQGSLYAAIRPVLDAIGIVDGYFDGQPAVWHKEILWAMSQGIAVFGAASMGALRAAELHSFGMQGIGRIFEDFRDGILMDDDEVALVHGPDETGYAILSEPMVNIRATIERGIEENVIGASTGRSWIAMAKSLFYQDRTWKRLMQKIGEDREELPRFRDWLPGNRVDRKREDALAMLAAMRARRESGAPVQKPDFHFEWTEAWESAPWRIQARETDGHDHSAILDELRLDGSYRDLRRQALLRLLAREETERMGRTPERRLIVDESRSFRTDRDLMRQADVAAWARANDTDPRAVDRMIEGRARIEDLGDLREDELIRLIIDLLREEGRYTALRDRAAAKRRWRTNAASRSGLSRHALLDWFFGQVRKQAVPDDFEKAALKLCVNQIEELFELLEAEYHYMILSSDPAEVTKEKH